MKRHTEADAGEEDAQREGSAAILDRHRKPVPQAFHGLLRRAERLLELGEVREVHVAVAVHVHHLAARFHLHAGAG